MTSKKKLLSATDMMNIYGFNRCKAYELLSRNDLPIFVSGRRKYMIADEFNRWLEQNAINANDDTANQTSDTVDNAKQIELLSSILHELKETNRCLSYLCEYTEIIKEKAVSPLSLKMLGYK